MIGSLERKGEDKRENRFYGIKTQGGWRVEPLTLTLLGSMLTTGCHWYATLNNKFQKTNTVERICLSEFTRWQAISQGKHIKIMVQMNIDHEKLLKIDQRAHNITLGFIDYAIKLGFRWI